LLAILVCAVPAWNGCTIRVDIDSSRAHVIRAKRLEREVKIEQAEAEYRLALEADRFNETAYHGLARIHLNRGESQRALSLLQKGVRHAERTPPLDVAARAASLIVLGRPQEAAYILEKALCKEPGRCDLRLLLAAAYFKDKKFRKASHEILLIPPDPRAGVHGSPAVRAARDIGLDKRSLRLLLYEVWTNYLRSLERDRWSTEAAEIAARAVERFPDAALFKAYLARLKYVHGEREHAMEFMCKALEQDPFDMEVVREARWVYVCERRYADALAVWRRAVPHGVVFAPDNRIKPRLDELAAFTHDAAERKSDPLAQRRLAAAYRRMGWVEEAIAQCKTALSLDPGDEDAAREMSRLQKHRRYLARIREYFDSIYDNEVRGISVPSIRAIAASLRAMARSEGIVLDDKGDDVYSLPLYGREIHVFNADHCPLAAYFLEFGQYLHLTEIHQPPFCKVMNIIAWFKNSRGIDTQCVVCDENRVRSLPGYVANRTVIGGHSTLSCRGIYVDFEGLRPNRYYIDMARKAVEEPSEDDVIAGFYSERGRDVLLARIMEGVDVSSDDAVFQKLSEAMVDAVAFHEMGHVVDLRRFVPIYAHMPAHLLEAVRGGFSPSRIRERLEMRAEVYSLAHSLQPHAVILNNLFRLRSRASGMRYIHYLLYCLPLESRSYTPYIYGARRIMEFARWYVEKETGSEVASAQTAVRLSEMSAEDLRKIGTALSRREGLE
jgi:tetratricopeptide (TPR) repeat protein